ncbi:MAG: hypothetical protein KY476_17190 [Planctomycetes bacterium]|nr:hypothetical protein [Planctomycetota bacterium]
MPAAFWPGGCGGDPRPASDEGKAPAAARAEHSAVPVDDPRHADPLVPPMDLDGLAVATIEPPPIIEPVVAPRLFGRSGLFAPDVTADDRAHFHPHGTKICASGCAASNHPTPHVTADDFRLLLSEYARGPLDETNRALETLLYFGPQTRTYLKLLGAGELDPARAGFLDQELRRTHALVSFRVVDEHGVVRTWMPPTRVPFDRRHVFEMETRDLEPLETSGTVKRVGLHHLWTRL